MSEDQILGQTMIEFDPDKELEKILQRFNKLPEKLAAPDTLSRALNATALKVRRQIIKDAEGKYHFRKKASLRDESRVRRSSIATLEAAVLADGHMREIMDFLTYPNTEHGAALAKVLNDGGAAKPLEVSTIGGKLKAFVTQFQSGHIAIVQREGAERLPVKKLLSPSVPHMLNNEEIRAKAAAITYAELQKQIEKHIQKTLDRMA